MPTIHFISHFITDVLNQNFKKKKILLFIKLLKKPIDKLLVNYHSFKTISRFLIFFFPNDIRRNKSMRIFIFLSLLIFFLKRGIREGLEETFSQRERKEISRIPQTSPDLYVSWVHIFSLIKFLSSRAFQVLSQSHKIEEFKHHFQLNRKHQYLFLKIKNKNISLL